MPGASACQRPTAAGVQASRSRSRCEVRAEAATGPLPHQTSNDRSEFQTAFFGGTVRAGHMEASGTLRRSWV